jgi:hypothetical protein
MINSYKFCSENNTGKDNVRDLGLDGKISTWTLKEIRCEVDLFQKRVQ